MDSAPPPREYASSHDVRERISSLMSEASSSDALRELLLNDENLVAESDDDVDAAALAAQEEEEAKGNRAARSAWLRGAGVTLLLALLAAAAVIFVRPTAKPQVRTAYADACSVFCAGPLLEAVQGARLWPDSKTFVDMPLVADPGDVLAAFSASFPPGGGAPSRDELAAFVSQHFQTAGSDTVPWVPPDYQPSPPMLGLISNDTLRNWALGLNDLWLTLGRRVLSTVKEYQQRFTLLWLPYGLIVPGGRFVEAYYWDSYWSCLGLLHSGMTATAAGVVLNLVHMLETFGYVPNGGRVYYSLPGRSQPPLLSSMIREVYGASGDAAFLARGFAALKREYAWMMRAGEYGHAVAVAVETPPTTPGGAPVRRVFVLNRYVTDQHIPRPESWAEDVHTAAEAGFAKDDPGAQILFSEIAAAAESGWDFSSRWFRDGARISTADTSHVLPADLNGIMLAVEGDLAAFAGALAEEIVDKACAPLARRAAAAAVAAEAQGAVGGGSGSDAWYADTARSGDLYTCATVVRYQCGGAGGGGNAAAALAPLLERLQARGPLSPTPLDADAAAGLAAVFTAHVEGISSCFGGLNASLRDEAKRYAAAAEERRAALDALMWDDASASWRDLIVEESAMPHAEPVGAPAPPTAVTNRAGVPVGCAVAHRYRARTDLALGVNVHHSSVVSASNYVPLWTGALRGQPHGAAARRARRLAASIEASRLLLPGGLQATTSDTPEQWDSPAGWAPLSHMVALGLVSTGEPSAMAMGREVARRWLASGLAGWQSAGYMFEKYDCRHVGVSGSGGEYVPQVGFAWTNGVALDLLIRFDFAHLEPPGAAGERGGSGGTGGDRN